MKCSPTRFRRRFRATFSSVSVKLTLLLQDVSLGTSSACLNVQDVECLASAFGFGRIEDSKRSCAPHPRPLPAHDGFRSTAFWPWMASKPLAAPHGLLSQALGASRPPSAGKKQQQKRLHFTRPSIKNQEHSRPSASLSPPALVLLTSCTSASTCGRTCSAPRVESRSRTVRPFKPHGSDKRVMS